MLYNIKYSLLTAFLALGLFISCGNEQASHEGHDHGEEQDDHSGHDHGEEAGHDDHPEGVFMSAEQMKTIGLEFGDFSKIKVNDYIQATGTLGVPPSSQASVSAKASGIVSGSKLIVVGNYIKKGSVIAYLENTEFIIKQQEYLEAKAMLKVKKLEFQRQKELVSSNAGVARNLQNAEAELSIIEAKTSGIAKQLSYWGISVKDLSPTSITQRISIKSPMSGHVTAINIHDGMYAQPEISLMVIISGDHLHLELDVFEKDISKVKIGQKISYGLPALGSKNYEGVVEIIGKEFDNESKTMRIHGHPEGEQPPFFKDLFMNARIWLNDQTVDAVPDEAVINDGASSYIYVAKDDVNASETSFEKLRVIVGSSNDGYTAVELIDAIPEGMKIITKGTYYVHAQSMVGELKHEH